MIIAGEREGRMRENGRMEEWIYVLALEDVFLSSTSGIFVESESEHCDQIGIKSSRGISDRFECSHWRRQSSLFGQQRPRLRLREVGQGSFGHCLLQSGDGRIDIQEYGQSIPVPLLPSMAQLSPLQHGSRTPSGWITD